MAITLLRVLVLGVIAAAADDVPVTWWSSRATLPCVVPGADRIAPRRPPPPLDAEDRARPKPFVWRRGEEELKRVSSNGTLEVSRKKDGSSDGVYQCAVRHLGGLVLGYPVHLKFAYDTCHDIFGYKIRPNTDGRLEKSPLHQILDLAIDKQFSVNPENTTARLGQPIVLSCEINSGPPAIFSWQRDGEPLLQSPRYHLLNNQLLITDVRNEDSGLYRCKATNTYANKSRISHSGRLQVEEYSGDLEAAIIPVQYETSVLAPRGTRVVLACPVVGWPRPKLIWELTPPGGRTSELEDVDEILILPSVEFDQEGVYTCTVEGNSDLVKSFNVTVTEPVVITVPPASKQSFRASTVRFNCTAAGRPAPNVTWYKDGEPLTPAGRTVVLPSADGKRFQLLIRSVTSDDAGVYQCFARNAASVASAWAVLNVTGAEAAAPGGVRCAPAGAHAVALRWPPLADVMAYTVQTTTPGGTSLPRQPVIGTEDIINVVEPLTPYGFQVRAYIRSARTNKTMASDLSERITCQGQGVPLKLAKLSEKSILVSWKQFAEQYPGVVQWVLQYKAENSSDENNVTLGEDVYNYTLKVSGQPMQVRVLGSRTPEWLQQNLTLVPWTSTTVASHGLDGGEVKVIPEDVEVTEVGTRGFTVRWRCEEAEASPETYSYMVCTRKVDGNEECMESHINSAVVENLQPDSEYEVRVQVRLPGRKLGGDFSVPIHISTPPEGLQPRFKDLTYKFVNATTLRVSWNSVPDKYTVHYGNELKLPINQWASVETWGNTVLLIGLDLTKELHVMVTGYEPVGHSSIMTVPIQIPEAKDLQHEYTEGGLRVWWQGRGPRVVRYSQNLTQPLDQWLTINVTQTTVTIPGLEPLLPTFVMVVAPGPSPRTQVVTISPRSPPDPSIFKIETKDLQYEYTRGGLRVWWQGSGPRVVRYSQNLTQPLDQWPAINVTQTTVTITGLEPSLPTFVMVVAPGPSSPTQVITISPQPPPNPSIFYLGVGIASGVILLCLMAVAAVCIWRRRKRSRSPLRSRRRNISANEGNEEEGAEMKSIGGRLANGNGSKDAGEPLLNGHVHITENPTSKTPNGRMRKGHRYEPTFDVARYDEADTTLETVIDADTSASTAYNLLDTSRRPEYDVSRISRDVSAHNSFNKLPDDNMNSELTRSVDFELDNSKIQPTLQPNG